MALCLGTFFFQSAVRKSAGSIPALLMTCANFFFLAVLFITGFVHGLRILVFMWNVGGGGKVAEGSIWWRINVFMSWECCMDEDVGG